MSDHSPRPSGTLIGIITYNPDLSGLRSLLDSVSLWNSDVVVCDNASKNVSSIQTLCSMFPCCTVFTSDVNLGISGAANTIFGIALAESKEFILLFDQDSIPDVGYMQVLIDAYRDLNSQAVNVAALGGLQTCRFTNDAQPFIQLGQWKSKKILPEKSSGPVPVDFLITSGTLIPANSLKNIGGYDSELFIDNVDVEWCCRAIALGYSLFGVLDAKFSHAIGEGRAKLLGFTVAKLHAPVRTFYIYRNIWVLFRRTYISRAWKINAVVRASLKIFFLLIYDKSRVEHLKAVFAALRSKKKNKSLAMINSEALSDVSR